MNHLVFYDGVCGLCNRLNRFVLAHDPGGRFGFAPLQSASAKEILKSYGRDPGDLDTIYLVADYRTASEKLLWRARAGLFVLKELGWPWSLGAILGILPTSLLDFCYGLVARTRYRIFGKLDTCPLPRPEHRERFIEI